MTAMSCCRLLYVPPVDFCLTLRFRRLFFRGFPDFVFVVLLALVLALRLVVFRLVLRFFLIPAFDPILRSSWTLASSTARLIRSS